MKRIVVIALLLCQYFTGLAQKVFVSKPFGFSMEMPANWLTTDSSFAAKNEANYTFSEKQAADILSLHKGAVVLTIKMKHDPNKHPGIIPTIKINAKATATSDREAFKQSMQKSVEQSIGSFKGFRYEAPFAIVTINGEKVIKVAVVYSLPYGTELLEARTYMYFFLRKGYFLQASFSDIPGKEDERALFDRLMQTVRFEI